MVDEGEQMVQEGGQLPNDTIYSQVLFLLQS